VDHYGPWAVVTGASGGIGRALATQLAQAGFDIVLVARRGDELDALAAELTVRHRIRTRIVAVDLATPAGCATVREQTADIDVGLLVANAGYGTSGPLHTADPEVERDLLAVNVRAVLDLTQHYAARLVARGRGGIILVSSIVALQGVAGTANYAASKAYVHTLGEGLHQELRPHGVDVLITAPGPVASGFGARAGLNQTGMTPDEVAHATLTALGHRRLVRPGRLSKLLGWSLALAPRRVRSHILARVIAGFTRQRQENRPHHENPAHEDVAT
jgi:short-subunit dehydrogenase